MVLVVVQLFVTGSYLPPVFKALNSPVPAHIIISLSVNTAVWLVRPSGALLVLVAVQLSVVGSYLPPVLKKVPPSHPPQMIISLLVQTAPG